MDCKKEKSKVIQGLLLLLSTTNNLKISSKKH